MSWLRWKGHAWLSMAMHAINVTQAYPGSQRFGDLLPFGVAPEFKGSRGPQTVFNLLSDAIRRVIGPDFAH